jgi:hypothetical protein
MNNVNFRISAYQVGDRSDPRYVWGLGLPRDFIDSLDEDRRRVQLEADDDKLYVKLNGKGIKLGDAGNPNGPMYWSSQIGLHHVKGLASPDETVRAKGVQGYWDAENHRLVVEDPPEFVKRAMAKSIHHEPHPEEQFPGTHFTDDVRKAAVDNADKPMAAFLQHDTTTEEIVEQAAIPTDPDSPTYQWFLAQVKRGQEGPFMEQVELTPELADILLRRNVGNRNIRQAKLNQYISDITNDRWQLNGETIQVSREGDLNNGQHRCSAVIAAHKSIRTFLGFGFTRESRTTVDVGATRRPGDHLSVQGYKNSTVLAGIARFVLAFEASGSERDLSYGNRITVAAINERVANDPLLIDATSFFVGHSKLKRFAPPSVVGFVYYMMAKINEDDAKRFMEQIAEGAGLENSDPAYTVRETLLNRPQLSRECKAEVFMRGWNAFRSGRSLRNIRIYYELPKLV